MDEQLLDQMSEQEAMQIFKEVFIRDKGNFNLHTKYRNGEIVGEELEILDEIGEDGKLHFKGENMILDDLKDEHRALYMYLVIPHPEVSNEKLIEICKAILTKNENKYNIVEKENQ